MADAAATPEPQGGALFYSQFEPLNAERHADLGVHSIPKPFTFAAQANVLLLTAQELIPAANTFPIVFNPGDFMPLAVTGLTEGQNLFVDAQGGYAIGAYVPAYLRRFPFIAAQEAGTDRMVICVERDTPLVSEGGDIRLFHKGEPTDYTKGCIEFCGNYERDLQQTRALVEYLKSHDLFGEQDITQPVIGADGKPTRLPLSTVTVVSEEKLKALPAETFIELRDNGALGLIYAHLLSQTNWERLLALRAERETAATGRIRFQ